MKKEFAKKVEIIFDGMVLPNIWGIDGFSTLKEKSRDNEVEGSLILKDGGIYNLFLDEEMLTVTLISSENPNLYQLLAIISKIEKTYPNKGWTFLSPVSYSK